MREEGGIEEGGGRATGRGNEGGGSGKKDVKDKELSRIEKEQGHKDVYLRWTERTYS